MINITITGIESLIKERKMAKKVRRPQKSKRLKTRYHKVLWDSDLPFNHKVIPNKKKQNKRKENKNLINSLIEEQI